MNWSPAPILTGITRYSSPSSSSAICTLWPFGVGQLHNSSIALSAPWRLSRPVLVRQTAAMASARGPCGAPPPIAGRTGARCRRGPVRHRSGGRGCIGRCSASPPSGAAARPSRRWVRRLPARTLEWQAKVPQTLSTRSLQRQRVAPFGEFVGQIAHQRAHVEPGHQGRHLAHDHRAGPERLPAPGRIRPARSARAASRSASAGSSSTISGNSSTWRATPCRASASFMRS